MKAIFRFTSLAFLTMTVLLNVLMLVSIISQYANAQVEDAGFASSISGSADTARYHIDISCTENTVDMLNVKVDQFGHWSSVTDHWVLTYNFWIDIDCNENETTSLSKRTLMYSGPPQESDSLLVTRKDPSHVLVTLIHQPKNYSVVCPLDGTSALGDEIYSNGGDTCFTCGGTVYYVVGTKGGFIQAKVTSITSVQFPISDKPTQYELNQNYPNPFNPSTTISFNIPLKSFVTLKVFDIIGREVATIVSEEMSAGTYSRKWNATNPSCGIYFYRLQAGTFIETKKLVLLK